MQLFREVETSGDPEQGLRFHELLWTAVVISTSFAVLYGEVIDLVLNCRLKRTRRLFTRPLCCIGRGVNLPSYVSSIFPVS